jgi:Ca2+-binding EF-hand superfamily protein
MLRFALVVRRVTLWGRHSCLPQQKADRNACPPVVGALVAILVCSAGAPTLPAVHAGDNNNEPKKLPPAMAQLLSGSAENFIKRFDRNKRGYLTKDELPPRLAAVFDKFDANSDNKLDKNEVQEMLIVLRQRFGLNTPDPSKPGTKPNDTKQVEKIVARFLEQMDTNKDGKISREEAKGPLANNFDRLDTNKDGQLDRSELRRAAERFLAARDNGKAGGPADSRPAAKPKPDFDALDSNADGRLTRAELQGTPFADAFDEIDTNKDGKIDRKEFEAYLRKQADKKAP